MIDAERVEGSRGYMEYEKPDVQWFLFNDIDILTISSGSEDEFLTPDSNEGGKYEGLPGIE